MSVIVTLLCLNVCIIISRKENSSRLPCILLTTIHVIWLNPSILLTEDNVGYVIIYLLVIVISGFVFRASYRLPPNVQRRFHLFSNIWVSKTRKQLRTN